MKTQRLFPAIPALLAMALLSGCGCRPTAPKPEPQASAEPLTNAPAPVGDLVRFEARPGSKVRLEGTSNIHDWQVEGTIVGGWVDLSPSFPANSSQPLPAGKLAAHAEVSIPIAAMHSLTKEGKPYSEKMDEIMSEKLLAPTHPKIRFYLAELAVRQTPVTNSGSFALQASGDLVVAGVTNRISMPVSIIPQGNSALKITGEATVKMSSFKIEPPAPKWLGSLIRTGDDVKLFFDWKVARKAASAAPVAESKAP